MDYPERDRPAQVTPEMIEAAVKEYEAWYRSGGADEHDVSGLANRILTAALRYLR
jgi:hypothetical protein